MKSSSKRLFILIGVVIVGIMIWNVQQDYYVKQKLENKISILEMDVERLEAKIKDD